MSERLRQYLRVHGGAGRPLLELRRHIERHGPPDAEGVRALSRRLGLPAAAVRAAASYYADLHRDPRALRVCRGTSCALAGAARLHGALAEQGPCEGVYCLGYCDRSPAVLLPDDTVVAAATLEGLAAAPAAEPMPSIRSLAASPIVTRHLLDGDAGDLEAARAAGVYRALREALDGAPDAVLRAVEASGERGRGGAAFPTGRKWRACAEAEGGPKYVVANGDEGDPGSFVDRVLMERDPHSILEGMILCGLAVGASEGVVFVRAEYPAALERVCRAVEQARGAGILGPSVMGSGFAFDVTVFPGMGSYVCGEETALLNAIEGFRGEVRLRPPYPVERGLHGCPTVVNNVETLVDIPWIVEHGAEAYRARGTPACPGTKALCLNHGFARPGIVEVEFGTSLRAVIEGAGGGGRDGAPLAAVLLGGPMGSVLAPDAWDVPVCYSAMADRGIGLGHGGLVAVPEGADFGALLVHWLEFMRDESCGRCVPCRVGSRVALEAARRPPDAERDATLRRLFDVMAQGSLCAFGQEMPGPMRALLDRFVGKGGAP